MNDTACLVMMMKNPLSGYAKTRLAATIGDDHAARLYRCFVDDLTDAFRGQVFHFAVFVSSPRPLSPVGPATEGIPCFLQQGNDLGERLVHAFQETFARGFAKVVVIGSDTPDLTAHDVQDAFSLLDGNDSVIGPTCDGGYYLIGFRNDSFLTDAFEAIPWSTDTVYRETAERISGAGLRFAKLAVKRDIDTIDDAKAFLDAHGTDTNGPRRTLAFLQVHRTIFS